MAIDGGGDFEGRRIMNGGGGGGIGGVARVQSERVR